MTEELQENVDTLQEEIENDEATQALISNVPKSSLVEEPEVIETVEEVEEVEEQPKQPTQEEVDSSSNFKALREARKEDAEARKRAERERDELMELLKASMAKKEDPKVPVDEEEDLRINEDDLVEGRHLKKNYARTMRETEKTRKEIEQLREEIAEEKRLAHQANTDMMLKNKYPDLHEVLSLENLKKFAKLNPELATTIRDSTDYYSKMVAAYTSIKQSGIYSDKKYDTEKQSIKTNTTKPRPLTSINSNQSASPLSKANAFAKGLTPELKSQIYKDMLEIRKRG